MDGEGKAKIFVDCSSGNMASVKTYPPFKGPVEDFFFQPIPKELWHYTNIEGFRGIISSQKIWATEAHFTNDLEEFVHARLVASAFIERMPTPDRDARIVRNSMREILLGAFDGGYLSKEITEVFIACFSAARDLKSQWIDYADKAKGVSIAFDFTELRLPMEARSTITFAPCLYEAREKERLLKIALGHLFDAGAEVLRRADDRWYVARRLKDWQMVDRIFGLKFDRSALNRAIYDEAQSTLLRSQARSSYDLLRLAGHCKNETFTAEHEWRLALPHLKAKILPAGEVKRRGKAIPYMELELGMPNTGLLPISEVMLGPLCVHGDLVRGWLNDAELASVPITRSGVPLRDTSTL